MQWKWWAFVLLPEQLGRYEFFHLFFELIASFLEFSFCMPLAKQLTTKKSWFLLIVSFLKLIIIIKKKSNVHKFLCSYSLTCERFHQIQEAQAWPLMFNNRETGIYESQVFCFLNRVTGVCSVIRSICRRLAVALLSPAWEQPPVVTPLNDIKRNLTQDSSNEIFRSQRTFLVEHFAQKMPPQLRQWCLRLIIENAWLQAMHSLVSLFEYIRCKKKKSPSLFLKVVLEFGEQIN